MKLEDRVEQIRLLIWNAFDKRLQRLGLMESSQYNQDRVLPENLEERKKLDDILDNLIGETGDYLHAREKLIDELCFTFFNRIAGVKVMEAHDFIHPIFTRDEAHGGRSFGHKRWLEDYPNQRSNPREGLRGYIKAEFTKISERIQLYSADYLYNMLPDVNELNEIIVEFNKIDEKDWHSDDIMGWMYEYYNRTKREEFKSKGDKIEYQWVSLTSQVYTPRWVVEFILNNSLGKLWMEMHPGSSLKDNHKIANIPDKATLEEKPVEEIKVLDPAVGSGNFLLYAFDLFYDMYLEEGEVPEEDIPQKIIGKNIFGIDLDDRAIQIAQLGLYIKALKYNRNVIIDHTNVVSTDFYLPEFDEISEVFRELKLHKDARDLLRYIWDDLRLAYKFGSLIRIEERVIPILEKYRKQGQISLLQVRDVDLLEQWEKTVIPAIKGAVEKYTTNGKGTGSFFKTKTLDSLTFVEILQNKFDVVVANPPYTSSGDFGTELKAFMVANYKKPLSFNSNLYSAFIKRNTELLNENGKMGMIHPLTFMYIKSYEYVRKYIINNYHINVLIEFGIGGVFLSSSVQVDVVGYILEKEKNVFDSFFMNLQAYKNHSNKNDIFLNSYSNYLNGVEDKHNFSLDQTKLKLIKSWPFIYWISDAFRGKFGSETIIDIANVAEGCKTANNFKFLRFHWEIDKNTLSNNYPVDYKKWVPYAKGGPYKKWFGNMWTLLNWEDSGKDLKKYNGANANNEKYYFREGITFTSAGSKGTCFRLLSIGSIFDTGSRSIFSNKCNTFYSLGLLNSSLVEYIIDSLNPTVNTTVGDIKRIPFAKPPKDIEYKVTQFVEENVEIKKHLCEFSIFEMNYKNNPLFWAKEKTDSNDLKNIIKSYLDYENELLAKVYLNEAEIDKLIFEVYDLSIEDKQMVLDKEGIPIGTFSNETNDESIIIIEELYEQNYSLLEICKKVETNPVAVTKILKESHVLPNRRVNDIAKDFMFEVVREVLHDDNDGITPLVDFAGEETLQKRLVDKLVEKGFTTAQISNYLEILGKDINHYIEENFFGDLCHRVKLYKRLPSTPFIWHLSAGKEGSFEAFVLIYKWSKDKLHLLKSVYVEKRESSLKNRLIDLQNDDSISAQTEKEKIQFQLNEIGEFKCKIDEVLQSGYDPKLDDGVGKNIAPLQEKGLLKVDVLKKNQLKKYLEADC